MWDLLLLDAEDDDTRPLKCVISIMCGVITATVVAFDNSSLNYTNAFGRHFSVWYESFIQLFNYFTDWLELPLVSITGHLLIQALFVVIAFQWWKVIYWMAMCGSCVLCRIATFDRRPVFSMKASNLEHFVAMIIAIVGVFSFLIFRELKVPPGTWVNELLEPITKGIVPMWEFEADWTIYPKQMAKYLITAAVWLLWWVPIVAVVEFIVAVPLIELRRNNESIQRGDDSL